MDFKKHEHWYDEIAIVSQVGLTMAGSILFCLAVGYGLDEWLGTGRIFTVVFILLGILGGVRDRLPTDHEGPQPERES